MKAGDKVRFTDAKAHDRAPSWFPPAGTIGTVIGTCDDGDVYVQWPERGASDYVRRWSAPAKLELVEAKEVNNENV